MAQTIQLKRTTSISPPPMTLAPGELSVEVGPGPTRVWLGDGTTNRLLLSSSPGDTAVAGTGFVHLTGDTMSGFLSLVADPRIDHPMDAATKQYVDAAAGLTGTYRGLYDPTTNTPDISGGDTVNQANYIVSVTGNMSTAVAGIPAGTPMTQGDRVIWSQDLAMWTHLAGGGGGAGLDKPTADTFYVNVVGDIMTGNLIMQAPRTVVLGANPTAALEAVPLQFLQSQLSGFLPLAGGVITGPVSFTAPATLTLAQNPVSPLEAATKQYVDAMGFPEAPNAVGPYGRLGAPSRSWVRAVAVAGDTMTGTLNVATGANINYQGNGNGQTAAPPVTLTNGAWTVAPIAFAWDGTGKLRWKVGGTDGGTIPGGDLSGAVGFPEAPTDGQIYGRQGSTASWQPVSSTVSTDTFPPAAPTDGMLWWDADSGQLFIRYDDGNSQQWVQANSGAAGGGSVAFPIPIVQGGTGQTDAVSALNALNGLSRNGGTMNGQLILSGPPQSGLAAVTRDFVTGGYLPLTGGVSFPMTGPLYTNGGGPPGVAISFSTAANVGLYGTASTVGISVSGVPRLVATTTGVDVGGLLTGSGTLQLGVSAADAIVDLRRASASFSNIIYGRTGNSLRWEMRLGTNTPESGSNAGGNFVVNRYGDNGVQIDTPMFIDRASGELFTNVIRVQPAGYAVIELRKAASGQGSILSGATGASQRWLVQVGDTSPETGSNAGSNFAINRCSDAGALIDAPLSINRATGTATFSGAQVTVNQPAAGTNAVLQISNTTRTYQLVTRTDGGLGIVDTNASRWDLVFDTNGNATFSATTGVTVPNLMFSSGFAGIYWGQPDSTVAAIQASPVSGGHQVVLGTGVAGNLQQCLIFANLCQNVSGTWSAISDISLKTDIQDYQHGLAEVLQLQPRSFRWANEDMDDGKVHYGFVAQEIELVLPELVGEVVREDKTVKTVDPTATIYAIVNALKEIEARLVALEGVA